MFEYTTRFEEFNEALHDSVLIDRAALLEIMTGYEYDYIMEAYKTAVTEWKSGEKDPWAQIAKYAMERDL